MVVLAVSVLLFSFLVVNALAGSGHEFVLVLPISEQDQNLQLIITENWCIQSDPSIAD